MNRAIYLTSLMLLVAAVSFSQTRKETEAALIGYWISSEAVVEIRPKNQITINGDRYEWAILGKTLVVSQGDDYADFPFELKGDTLTVWVEGRKVVYSRTDKEGAEEAMAQLARRRGGGSGGRNDDGGEGGSNPQDLVGKWCYQANVQAQGGGRQSDICFTLKADGTYEYYGEATTTNPYGGANSQSWDYGRWSATATTLTARSNSGKTTTYTLERRNHPRTGDPMLIVDGDAFVTYYQKRPW
ncbi:hypothetical protein [Leptolyngbya sp. 7M]|uniref:hypothetical protein n=1 Tax=Leptolyngbya sp. 7M TaxID=2812896 RepID=UPI001B8BCFAF|nr:hypothetical protein [Leptolyngbya sp. 7M]QYO66101.1 hypothetical protein JVX88_04685 [Leptolyngbya sp. 7M]